jgi:hypothetical protein
VDKDLSGRIKTLEEKLKGTAADKKPKDLRRAIGKVHAYVNILHSMDPELVRNDHMMWSKS